MYPGRAKRGDCESVDGGGSSVNTTVSRNKFINSDK
jgi:hypothetical protein